MSRSIPARVSHRIVAIVPTLIAIALLVSPAAAQQFVDETATRFPSGLLEYSNQATIGDIDSDGDLDVLFANGSGFVCPGPAQKARVFINDGSGFFTDETDARTGGITGRFRGAELGDCDNDGDLDILLAQDCDALPGLLINDSNGFFTSEGGTRLPNITLASSRGQFGDVDNDGDLDIFITSGTSSRFTCGQYRLYVNDGTCNYTDVTGVDFPTGNVCNNMDCIFGDIDGDFDIDIRTGSTGTGNSKLYRNDGEGGFTEVAGVPIDSSCYSYDFGDIDGDGDLDLLGANGALGSNSEMLLENDGAGNYTNVSGQISPFNSDDDNDSKFIDYDNDGDLDLLVGRIGGAEKMYQNDGNGNFTLAGGIVQAVGDSTLDIMVADLTGDGAYDIVTAQGESGNYTNRIYRNTGPADTFPPTIVGTELPSPPAEDGPWVIRAAILDQMTSDRNFFTGAIRLKYTVDAGPELQVGMRHSGGQIYRGEIPDQPSGSLIEYYVLASDAAGNSAIGLTESFIVPDCASVASCSGNGTCIGVGVCDCDPGWGGPDCSEFAAEPAGEVPAGFGPENPLTARLTPTGQIRLSWSASCNPTDEDFAVYQGTLGDFTSHLPLVCTTGGLTAKVIASPDPGDLYFLVVPKSFNAEGGYGDDSSGSPRPASPAACAPAAAVVCP